MNMEDSIELRLKGLFRGHPKIYKKSKNTLLGLKLRDVCVIGGSGTDCLTLVREMSRKQESPPSFILSNKERTKAQKNSFSRCFSGSGGRL